MNNIFLNNLICYGDFVSGLAFKKVSAKLVLPANFVSLYTMENKGKCVLYINLQFQ